LFYDATTGLGATATLDGDGTYGYVGSIPGFSTGWDQIVGTDQGGLLFYDADTGAGATATLDIAGNYAYVRELSGFSQGWTHIVGT
ncbi:MAG TPA: hypothetical protein VM869_02405, partial [Enhygromyxa sp.]|nr:hypothetical protein [Enhygromyxa sp.]